MGHALNKVLKDMVNRTMVMGGRRVDYRPGWDCHGLPIELKALQELRAKEVEENAEAKKKLKKEGVKESAKGAMEMGKRLSPEEIRGVARSLAERAVGGQMEGFQGWGVMADWEGRWGTMGRELLICVFFGEGEWRSGCGLDGG